MNFKREPIDISEIIGDSRNASNGTQFRSSGSRAGLK